MVVGFFFRDAEEGITEPTYVFGKGGTKDAAWTGVTAGSPILVAMRFSRPYVPVTILKKERTKQKAVWSLR